MDRVLFGLVIGVVATLFLPLLLPWWLNVALFLLGCFIFAKHRFISGLLFALVWANVFFSYQLSWLEKLNPEDTQMIQGTIIAVNVTSNYQTLEMCLEQIDSYSLLICPHIRLTANKNHELFHKNDEITGLVRLKVAHGLANPVGFHSETWLLSHGITATGAIKKVLSHHLNYQHWRESWLQQSKNLMSGLDQSELLMALIYGEQQDVAEQDWALLRESGLIHLIAISGAHIGIVAWMAMCLSRIIFFRCHDRFRAIHYLAGICIALFYCALADFSVPTVRALTMFTLWSVLKIFCRQWSQVRSLLFITALILVISPWAAFSIGFWFSIFAVAILGLSGFLCKKTSIIHIQWLMTILLLPLQLVWFGGFSMTSLGVNLLAGPWFTFLIVPQALCAGLFVPLLPSLSQILFHWCNWQLDWVMKLLAWVHQFGSGWWVLSEKIQYGLCWGLLLYLIWRYGKAFPKQRMVWIGISALGLVGVMVQSEPKWRVDFLDIGQGLSVLISQHDKALIFDTGDSYGRYNMADAVIEPMLAYRGIQKVDYLVISHKDKDHAANWLQLHQAHPEAQIISSGLLTDQTEICQTGQYFRWASLDIFVLSPQQSKGGDQNEDSCVLKISDGIHSVLLTGDIQKRAERDFSQLPEDQTHADIMSTPHHGSHSSSTIEFINAVSPTWVVHSAGYQNRWHHPHQDIVERYQRFNVNQLITATDGLVTADINEEIELSAYRHHQPWYQHLNTWLQRHDPLE